MKLIDFLDLTPQNLKDFKIHCAIGPEIKREPLYAFFEGRFDKWQAWQRNPNFERPYVLSLLYYNPSEWIFAGIYKVENRIDFDDHCEYLLVQQSTAQEFVGRLILQFPKEFRNSYLLLENNESSITILEVLRDRMQAEDFPGYENVLISYEKLQVIIRQNVKSWYTALSNVKGVYCITDTLTGKLYIGSAYNEDSFWTRWGNYTQSGTGGNVLLEELIKRNSIEYAKNYHFSILEIFKHSTENDIIQKREQFWKDVFLTRKFGYNAN